MDLRLEHSLSSEARINLLPWREEKRAQDTLRLLVLSISVVMLIVIVGFFGQQWFEQENALLEKKWLHAQTTLSQIEPQLNTLRAQNNTTRLYKQKNNASQRQFQQVALRAIALTQKTEKIHLTQLDASPTQLKISGTAPTSMAVFSWLEQLKDPAIKQLQLEKLGIRKNSSIYEFMVTLHGVLRKDIATLP